MALEKNKLTYTYVFDVVQMISNFFASECYKTDLRASAISKSSGGITVKVGGEGI